jgi:hypothetical protein
MQQSPPIKEIVTIAEMARTIGLSRARFYELMKNGVFPAPSRNPTTKRPFYDRQQQEQCLLIRRSNCGANGQAVLFYSRQPMSMPAPKRSPATQRKRHSDLSDQTAGSPRDALVEELRHGLQQLGLAEITPAIIRTALAEEYPDGHDQVDRSDLLLSIFRRLKRQNSQDNVAG